MTIRWLMIALCSLGLASTASAHELKTTPKTGGQLSLFSNGRGKQIYSALRKQYAQRFSKHPDLIDYAFKDMRLVGDVGEHPHSPGEYYVQLRNTKTGAYRLMSIREKAGQYDVGISSDDNRALAWTSTNKLFTVGRTYRKSHTAIEFGSDGISGSNSSFPGIPQRVVERKDGSFEIHGRSFDNRPIKQGFGKDGFASGTVTYLK